MDSALEDFYSLRYSTQLASLYESYLVAKWFEANDRGPVTISDANDAVSGLFTLSANHTLGRLYPFRYSWIGDESSGRKTVWNNTTRGGGKLAASIFNAGGDRNERDIRNGLAGDAAEIVCREIRNRNKRLPRWTSLACLVLRDHSFLDQHTWNDARHLLETKLGMNENELGLVTVEDNQKKLLLSEIEWEIDNVPEKLAPRETIGRKELSTSDSDNAADDVTEVVIDRRVERMLKQAVKKYPFIMLVGPPGTGKGKLIQWLAEDISTHPAEYGFQDDYEPDLLWRTPDESWSAFDLVGGFVPNEAGALEWSPGLLMNAISEEKWLILDEANRADMDRIMGPLLTWLSEQEVEIGKTKPTGGKSITLGWTSAPNNREEESANHNAVRYLAGRNWRLFGTYNPQDALRVFRFGQALSRRFVIIPIPAISPGQFEELLTSSFQSIDDECAAMITGLYSAHLDDRETVLGPAVFLRMARYLNTDDIEADADGHENRQYQVAEAYVMNVGKYLASYEESVMESLICRILEEISGFDSVQWDWIAAQRNTIL